MSSPALFTAILMAAAVNAVAVPPPMADAIPPIPYNMDRRPPYLSYRAAEVVSILTVAPQVPKSTHSLATTAKAPETSESPGKSPSLYHSMYHSASTTAKVSETSKSYSMSLSPVTTAKGSETTSPETTGKAHSSEDTSKLQGPVTTTITTMKTVTSRPIITLPETTETFHLVPVTRTRTLTRTSTRTTFNPRASATEVNHEADVLKSAAVAAAAVLLDNDPELSHESNEIITAARALLDSYLEPSKLDDEPFDHTLNGKQFHPLFDNIGNSNINNAKRDTDALESDLTDGAPRVVNYACNTVTGREARRRCRARSTLREWYARMGPLPARIHDLPARALDEMDPDTTLPGDDKDTLAARTAPEAADDFASASLIRNRRKMIAQKQAEAAQIAPRDAAPRSEGRAAATAVGGSWFALALTLLFLAFA